jgi:hypothetical protein
LLHRIDDTEINVNVGWHDLQPGNACCPGAANMVPDSVE